MKECGVSCDKEALATFFKCIEGKNVADAVKEGQKKLVSFPSCGGGARPAAAAGAPAGKAAEAPKEVKKEEVEAVDMGGLFGGDNDY